MRPEWIPLSDAAHAIRKSYDQTLRLAHTGVLEARREPNGRWMIRRTSVDAFIETGPGRGSPASDPST